MDTTLNKGMVALPIEDYDRFKELEKKDYDFSTDKTLLSLS